MRVAIVVRRLSPRGGIESNVLAFARFLARRGHQVQIVCQRVEAGAEVEAEIVRVEVPSVFGESAKLFLFASRAAREVRRLAPDVSYAAGHVYGVDVARLEMGLAAEHRAAIARGASAFGRLVSAIEPTERAAEVVERRKIAEARRVLVLSERDARAVAARYGVAAIVARNGIDLTRFVALRSPSARAGSKEERTVAQGLEGAAGAASLPERGRVIGFVGNGFARKGLMPLIEAAAKIDGAKLIVAGKDRRKEHYAARARALGLDATFLGPVADVREVFAAIDVLAMPSLYEPFGLVALEAWASGRPVVLSAIAGASELAPHPELIVRDPLDTTELAAAIERAFTADPAPSRKAAEACSLEQSLEHLESILLEARRR